MTTIFNPAVPLNINIQGGVQLGKLIRVQGFIPHTSNRFSVKLICSPTGDVALYLSPNFNEKCIIRNTIQNRQMGYEERSGLMPIQPGQNFELLILCDHQNFKIAFNGQHFTEFYHKLLYSAITNLEIDGQVNIYLINIDMNKTNTSQNIGLVIPPNSNYAPSAGHTVPPYPSGGPVVGIPYPPNPPSYSAYQPNNPPYPPETGFRNPPYAQQPPAGHLSGYPNSQPSHGIYPQQPSSGSTGGYPQSHPSQGGYPHSPKSHKSSGLLDKAGMAVAGVLGTSALLGGKKAMKKQMKAHKKALKFGLPLAGAGIGAYALSKGIHGFRRSSSSSSSSSD